MEQYNRSEMNDLSIEETKSVGKNDSNDDKNDEDEEEVELIHQSLFNSGINNEDKIIRVKDKTEDEKVEDDEIKEYA